MRLTLRTLLAYLDDILPPAQAKEIGEKIASTPVAAELVDRIKDVVRRRRLTAPEADGGLDPNLIADYLDNSLPPERVADVERLCLESDVNLAEVAACHQILTLVLGEPVEVPPRLRERAYALAAPPEVNGADPPSASKAVRETTAREQLAAIRGADRAAPAVKPAAKGSLEDGLPEYLRRGPAWKRVLPLALAALVAAVWLGLVVFDDTLFPDRGEKVAANDPKDDPALDPKAPADEVRRGAAAVGLPPAEVRTPAEELEGDNAEMPDLPLDPEPPIDEPPLTAEGANDRTTPRPSEAVAGGVGTVVPQPPQPGPAAGPATPAAPANFGPADGNPAAPVLAVTPSRGLALAEDPASGAWFPLAAENAPPAGGSVAVPEPFEADLTLGDLPLRVTALGGTRLRPLGPTAAAPAGLDIRQGRLRLAAVPPAGAASVADPVTEETDAAGGTEPAPADAAPTGAAPAEATPAAPPQPGPMFAVLLGPTLWRVEFLAADSAAGLEVVPLQPVAPGQDLSRETPRAVLYVTAGAVRIADAAGRVFVAAAGGRLEMSPPGAAPPEAAATPAAPPRDDALDTAAAAAGDAAPMADPAAEETPKPVADPLSGGPPEWLVASGPTAAARSATAAFQREFLAGVPVAQSLLPVVDARVFYIAEFSVKALGLIEHVPGLVKALRESQDEGALLAAGDGLRNWLGRSPANGERLRAELGAVFSADEVDVLHRLLWGYGPAEARDRPTATQLVEWLDHPLPAVRVLAFAYVQRLSEGRTMGYRPLQQPAQRSGPVRRWREFVGQHGGLVIGGPQPSAN